MLKKIIVVLLALVFTFGVSSVAMAQKPHRGGGGAHWVKPGVGNWGKPGANHWVRPDAGRHWYKPWSWGYHPQRPYYPEYRPPAWWLPGVLGGLVLGGILNGKKVEAFSQEWYEYCTERYRSFNPETGKYMGYDGEWHFCRVEED